MTPEDAKKLLGGYATGTLTPEEQQALFQAALEDQDLFDALAEEQSLKEVMDDPALRAELLDAVNTEEKQGWFAGALVAASSAMPSAPSPAPAPPPARKRGWFERWWPVPAGIGALALASLTIFVVARREPAPIMVAENRPAPTIEAAPPIAMRSDSSKLATTPSPKKAKIAESALQAAPEVARREDLQSQP